MNQARSPERVLTPLRGILGTRSVGKPAMKLPRKDREEVEVLRGSLHGVVRVLQAAQLHLRLQEAVFLPGRSDERHVLPRVGQEVDLRARVVVPKGHKRSHEFREGTRHGDVVLRHARRHRGLLRVHRGVAEHQGPS